MNAAVLRRSSAVIVPSAAAINAHMAMLAFAKSLLLYLATCVFVLPCRSAIRLFSWSHSAMTASSSSLSLYVRACIHASISSPARTPVVAVTVRWSLVNPASASSPWAGRIAASAASSRSASSSESPAASSGATAEPVADLQGGRRLGQRAGHRVDLAALQRHRPAARVAPRRELLDPALGEQRRGRRRRRRRGRSATRCAQHERPPPSPGGGTATSASGAHPASRAATRVRPVGVGHAVDEQVAAVGRDRVAGRRAGQADPGDCSRVRVVVGTTCAASAVRSSSAAVSVM